VFSFREPIRSASEPTSSNAIIAAATQGTSSAPVKATWPTGLVPDSPLTVGPLVGELPPPPPTDEVDELEELPLLDDDVGGELVEVELEGGGVVELGLGQLVRSVAASSEK